MKERIKAARIMAGFSLRELAGKIGGISKQALHNYETGKVIPDHEMLIKIGKATDQPYSYFTNTAKREITFGEWHVYKVKH